MMTAKLIYIDKAGLPWITIAQGPWGHSNIVCTYTDEPRPLHAAVQRRIEQMQEGDSRSLFNGLGYRLDGFDVSDPNVLRLSSRPSDYFSMLATDNALDEPIELDGKRTTLCAYYMQGADMTVKPIDGIASFMGITLQIVTKDLFTIFHRRGNTATSANSMFCSLAESCSRPEDGSPDMLITALRGLREEYDLTIAPDDIEWTSFGANLVFGEYNLSGIVRLDMTAEELTPYLSAGVDSWERNDVFVSAFTPDDVVSFMNRHEKWTTLGIATIYHALLASYDEASVDAAFNRLKASAVDFSL
jgi:hypothetical protein